MPQYYLISKRGTVVVVIAFNLPIGIVFGVLYNQVHSGINFFTYNTLEWGQIQANFWWVFMLKRKSHCFHSLFGLIRELSNSNWTENNNLTLTLFCLGSATLRHCSVVTQGAKLLAFPL